jgi:polar amino acid transport system substrate-binding protein
MNPFFQKFICACVLVFATIGCKDEKKDDGTSPIVVATSADYPPFEYFKDTEIVGFEIDLMRAIAAELKREVKFQDLNFDSILGALQSKRVDLAISAISATPERQKVVDFTIHYNSSRTVLITNDPSFSTIDNLKGKTVGVQMGSTYESSMREVQSKIQDLKIQSLTKIPDLIQSLKTNRIAAIALGINEANTIMKEINSLKMIDLPDTEISYAIALPKGSELTSQINAIIEKMKKNGSLAAIQDKWFNEKKIG